MRIKSMSAKDSVTTPSASMERLRRAAADLQQIHSVAELALALDESSQTVGNWAMRGVSKAGALKAEKVLGVSAKWITDGGHTSVQRASAADQQPGGAGAAELVMRRLRALLLEVPLDQRDVLGRQLQALAHAPDSAQLAMQILGVLASARRDR